MLVQGWIHLPKSVDRTKFYEAWETSLIDQFIAKLNKTGLTEEELSYANRMKKPGILTGHGTRNID